VKIALDPWMFRYVPLTDLTDLTDLTADVG
jgi:hypothetical protein